MQLIFSVLTLYPATLLTSFISFDSISVEILGFSTYKMISSVNRDNFTSSFPVWMLFVSFSCLIAQARTSNSILNRRDDSGHLCLISDLREKLSFFHHSTLCLLWVFHRWILLC